MSISHRIDLGVFQRLGTGRSIESFQQNLLEELRPILPWDHAIPTTPNANTVCPAGLWKSDDIPCETCKDWCLCAVRTELMEAGLLVMLNLKGQSTSNVQDISSLGVLLLRRDRPFDNCEIETLTPIHEALQLLLEQSIALDWLIHKTAESETMANLEPTANSQTDSHPDGHPDGLQSLSDPLFTDLGLTPRQCEVIHLLMKGNGTRTIAQSIGCSEATVRKHLENLYRRLGVQNRTAAIAHILGKIGIV